MLSIGISPPMHDVMPGSSYIIHKKYKNLKAIPMKCVNKDTSFNQDTLYTVPIL